MYIQSSLLLTITKFSMLHVSQILPVHFPNDTHLSCFQLPLIRNSAMACKIQSPRQRSLCEFISGVFPPSDGYAESQHNQHNLNSLFFRMAYEFTLLSTHQFFFSFLISIWTFTFPIVAILMGIHTVVSHRFLNFPFFAYQWV